MIQSYLMFARIMIMLALCILCSIVEQLFSCDILLVN